MAEAPISLKRKLSADSLREAANARELEYIVFLGGPFIDPTDEKKSNGSASSILRYKLFHMLEDEQYTVSLGEYKSLIDSYKDTLGRHHNSVISEVIHATNTADAIVLIVDSPGSFAEIGAFSMKEDICKKMLVISDKIHENSEGYVATGPIVLSKSLGAQITYVNLLEVEKINKIVQRFIKENIQLKVLREMVKR